MKNLRQLSAEIPRIPEVRKSSKIDVKEGYPMSYLSLMSEQKNKTSKVV